MWPSQLEWMIAADDVSVDVEQVVVGGNGTVDQLVLDHVGGVLVRRREGCRDAGYVLRYFAGAPSQL